LIISSVAHTAREVVLKKLKLSGIHLQENKMRAEFPIDSDLIHVRIGLEFIFRQGNSPSEQKEHLQSNTERENG
jgi:hypothetical protein